MAKIVIAVAFAAGLVAGICLNLLSKPSQAAELSSCVIPKTYGSVKAAASAYLVFEGSDGTIRLINDACQTMRVLTRK